MTALINQAVYTIENYIADQQLDAYNQAVDGMLAWVTNSSCGLLGCACGMCMLFAKIAITINRWQLLVD